LTVELPGAEYAVDPAELAAVAFLGCSACVELGPPSPPATNWSRTDRAMLARSGDKIRPYEQRWVMDSGRALPLVGTVAVVEHCA